MLRKIRIVLAAIFFIGITLLFLGFAGVLEPWLGWMPKVQFLPAFLAVNVGVVAALLLLTFVFGRVYCSTICPMGVYQDIVAWISRKVRGRKAVYHYNKGLKYLRYGIWVLFVIALVAGVHAFVSILAPYSAYGRMVRTFFGGNAELPILVIAVSTFVVITVMAWIGGRTYCNTVCPVGTTLSFVSRFSLFRPAMDKDKCVKCHACERKCKAHCIDVENGIVDYSRCVVCFDCMESCRPGGLKYSFAYGKKAAGKTEEPVLKKPEASAPNDNPRRSGSPEYSNPTSSPKPAEEKKTTGEAPTPNDNPDKAGYTEPETPRQPETSGTTESEPDESRRAFLIGTAVMAGGAVTAKVAAVSTAIAGAAVNAAAQGGKKVDGGLAEIVPKQSPQRTAPITPFGSKSAKHFYQHCTACQLCVTACPNHVLRPGMKLDRFMQPEMGYENGWCRPECTKCSEVCPAGAILPITPEEKTAIHVGTAAVDYDLCVVNRDGVRCGNCARHCPAGAIMMVPKDPGNPDSPRIPSVNEARCIGCGACENLCPSRPISAIRVNGLSVHIED